MKAFKKSIAPLLLAAVLAFVAEGCSTYTVRAAQAPRTDDTYSECAVSWFWGLQDPQINAPCDGQGLEVVAVQTNWLYSLCTVGTLGIISPATVKYRCAGPPLINGDPMGANSGED